MAITGLAFYLVFKKVSWKEFSMLFRQLELFWVAVAFLLYNVSQCVSAARLWSFYRLLDIPVSYTENLRLYYKAMFYGLFLPGGISGDAYKVFWLQHKYKRTYRELITATLSDRANGLVVLLSIGMLMVVAVYKKLAMYIDNLPLVIILLLIFGWILYVWLMYSFVKPFYQLILKATILSIIIQCLQLLAFFCIMAALNISASQWILYGILFYAGSVASALPLSIGGMGIREWVMVTGAGIFALQQEYAFTASFTFFLVVSLSSLCGAVLNFISPENKITLPNFKAAKIS